MAKLVSRLDTLVDRVDAGVTSRMDQVATFILQMIKVFAPVDTGALRRSYERDDLNKLHILIGSVLVNAGFSGKRDGNVNYAPFQEFGTRKMAARPHLRPGFERGSAIIEAELVKGIKSALK